MHAERYYRSSGKFSGAALLATAGIGGIAGVALAIAYAYVILYIPIAGTVTFILTAGFGFLLGAFLGFLLHKTKVRSTSAATLTALGVATFSWVASWYAWIYALLRRDASDSELSVVGLLLDPVGFWEIVLKVNEGGAWSFKNVTPTGGVLWALWALEAVIVVGVAAFTAPRAVEDPFCEACDRWCDEHEGVAVAGQAEPASLKASLEAGNFAALKELPEPTPALFTRFDLHLCPQCQGLATLSAKGVVVTEKNGKPSTDESDLVRFLALSRSELEAFRSALPQRTPTAVAAGEPAPGA